MSVKAGWAVESARLEARLKIARLRARNWMHRNYIKKLDRRESFSDSFDPASSAGAATTSIGCAFLRPV